ncbi:hypothetical protein Sste5346_006399 [Sporothrix stenoceras]|uniref:Integral membrane protein n=1 Tax=Sporothrix stenoceras TaxID=5173 RepID=A0ABR3Z227_9PEZI
MYEYTPAHSIASEDDYQYEDEEHRPSRLRLVLRALNAALHFVACSLLVTIMALFLAHPHHRRKHRRTEPQAVTLIILLALDMLVDVATFVRLRSHIHITIVLAHLVLGLAYLTVFIVDVGAGSVFSGGYTFWGLPESMAGPVVYSFLWTLGVWDLLHTVLHRHEVGRVSASYR